MLDRVVPDSVIPAVLVDVLVGPGSGIPGAPNAGLQPAANARGVLARRSGVTPEQVAGTGWDIALGVSRICFVDRFQLLLSRYAFHVQIMLHFSCREVGSPFPFGERGRTNERMRLKVLIEFHLYYLVLCTSCDIRRLTTTFTVLVSYVHVLHFTNIQFSSISNQDSRVVIIYLNAMS